MYKQIEIQLQARPRGFHLVTEDILAAIAMQTNILPQTPTGLLHLFLQHTSASLTLNENADPDVLLDMENIFSRLSPDGEAGTIHTCEGPDDMPAHIKSSLIGTSVWIPIKDGRLALGTWQGIVLGEHRNHGGSRKILATIQS
jgi:secondary thiamine-phosphate synthase enzyme